MDPKIKEFAVYAKFNPSPHRQSLNTELKNLRNALSLNQPSSPSRSKPSKTRLTDLSNPSDLKKATLTTMGKKFDLMTEHYKRNPNKRSRTDVCHKSYREASARNQHPEELLKTQNAIAAQKKEDQFVEY